MNLRSESIIRQGEKGSKMKVEEGNEQSKVKVRGEMMCECKREKDRELQVRKKSGVYVRKAKREEMGWGLKRWFPVTN